MTIIDQLRQLKVELVAAHRAQDWELAKVLSQRKSALRRRLRGTCQTCGVTIDRKAKRFCRIHLNAHRYYSRSLSGITKESETRAF